jgi:uncharacterized membrane protein YraQ (UPF0718 family)
MYVNAETFFPISAALLEKGVGTGAVITLVTTVRVKEYRRFCYLGAYSGLRRLASSASALQERL